MTFGPDETKGARITSLDEFNKCLDHCTPHLEPTIHTPELTILTH